MDNDMNNDLISREKLREAFSNNCLHNCYYCKLAKWDKKGACYNCGLIDNAPTINPCNNCDLYFKAMTKEEMKKGGAV